MNKIYDPKLFANIRSFLTYYLPQVRSRSPHTIQAYKDSINLFVRFLKADKNKAMHQITSEDFNRENLVGFMSWLETERNCSISTRNQRLMSIRAFCNYLSNEDVLTFERYVKIKGIKPIPQSQNPLSEILTIEQVKYLLALPDISTRIGIRDRFYMALLYDTGCRNNEILSLMLNDIIVRNGRGEVKITGKGRKFRLTPLSSEIIEMFKQYERLYHSDNFLQKPLFYTKRQGITTQMSPDNSARILKKYEAISAKRSYQLPHLHPHLFRHSRAMHLYQAGMPLALVSEWLGHSNLETTLIYASADTDMKRNAIEKLSSANSAVFSDEAFAYPDDELSLKKLYGLS